MRRLLRRRLHEYVATAVGARRVQQVPEPSTRPTQPSTRGERPLPSYHHGGHSCRTHRHSGTSRCTTPPRPPPRPGGWSISASLTLDTRWSTSVVMNTVCSLPPKAQQSSGHNGVPITLPPCSNQAGRGHSHRCIGPSTLVSDPRRWPPQTSSPLLSYQGLTSSTNGPLAPRGSSGSSWTQPYAPDLHARHETAVKRR